MTDAFLIPDLTPHREAPLVILAGRRVVALDVRGNSQQMQRKGDQPRVTELLRDQQTLASQGARTKRIVFEISDPTEPVQRPRGCPAIALLAGDGQALVEQAPRLPQIALMVGQPGRAMQRLCPRARSIGRGEE